MHLTKYKIFDYILFYTRVLRINRYFVRNNIRKLHLGSGTLHLTGWINSDIKYLRGGIYLDVKKTFPFKNNSIDYIFAEHLIEHLNYEDGDQMLRECFRVLKPEGKIRVATPDLDVFVKLYLSKKTSSLQKRYISFVKKYYIHKYAKAGNDSLFVLNNMFYSWGHRFIYNNILLITKLKLCGFKNVKNFLPGKSDDGNFENIDGHEKMIGKEINRFETMVLEASKPMS